MVKELLKNKIKELYPNIDFDILIPPEEKLGDYSVNLAFVLAKKENRSPKEVGEELAVKFSKNEEFKKYFSKIELAGVGFINFYLRDSFLTDQLKEINRNKNYGSGRLGNGKKVIVEYGGVNIAKPMHIGHLRSTIIGDALANVYEFLGYKVIRWNYIGDWGTQFGKLIAAHKKWLDKSAYQKDPIAEMLRLYVKFHDELKNNPELEGEGREEFRKLEEGDQNNRKIWKEFRSKSLEEFNKLFDELNVALGQGGVVVKGESGYESRLKPLINELKKKGFIKESEGALIFEFKNLPPAMFQKSDGATLYITRDLASLEDRVNNYKVDKILYVVANQQALHFEQLFTVAEKIGLKKNELVHVKFGMVLGEDGQKLATREGKIIALQDVINKVVGLASDEVGKRHSDWSKNKIKKTGKAIGIGALKYNDLKQHPHSDIVFDWKAMLDLQGNSGPYLQYTYARLRSIIRRSKFYPPIRIIDRPLYVLPNWIGRLLAKIDTSKLTIEKDLIVIKKLLDFPDVVSRSAKLNTLNGLALYLYELSSTANHYYETIEKLSDYSKRPERNARLMLVETTAEVLKRGLNLLGIEALERV